MIREYNIKNTPKILYIINNASLRYKDIIPDNCWKEPYMSEEELVKEFRDGVRIFGYLHNHKLIAVIGVQKIKDVILIRHAYTLLSYQGMGAGSALLEYLLKKNQSSRLLVGTWKNAKWAIKFYQKFGFNLHKKNQSILLLKKYWKITLIQMKNSVVLEK